MIAKLERVPLRDVWRNESLFTQWLEDNIDVLSEALDVTLSNAGREQSAGAFSVDIATEDEAGNPVIIENQLAKSDHDHLGKLITYLTALEAKTAIWIISHLKPEHVRAISWANESSPASFYLVKLEAVRIGKSPCAPLFTVIVGPSEEARKVGETKQELAERHKRLHAFWTNLLELAKQRTKVHANVSPSYGSWIAAGAGIGGLVYSYVTRKSDWHVEPYIDRGKEAEEENKAIFDSLAKSKNAIESACGEPLEWQRLEGKRACRIKSRSSVGSYRDEAQWPHIHETMVDAMIRFEKALKPHIANLKK